MTSVLVAELISKASTAGTNLRHVTRELGIPDDKVKNWMRGTAEPSADEVKRICEKLGVDAPKVKAKPVEKTETPAVGKTKEREPEEKVTEVKPAKDGFMPKPELFSKNEVSKDNTPTLEELSKAALTCGPDKFVVGEVTETKKGEKKMTEKYVYCTECARCRLDEDANTNCGCENACDSKNPEDSRPISERPMFEKIKNQPKEQPKEAEKPKRTRSASPKKPGKKQFLSEESEVFVRKSAGLKKSEEITEKAVAEAFKSGMSVVKQKMDELARLEKDVTKALFAAGEAPVDDRLKKLLEAAEKASDEGISVAITILEKFRK